MEPRDVGLGAKPRALALGAPAGRTRERVHRGRKIAGAAQVRAELAVPDAPERREVGTPAPRPQCTDLVEKAGGNHGAAARLDACRELVAPAHTADHERIEAVLAEAVRVLPGAD